MKASFSILSFSFLFFLTTKGQSSENIKQVQQKILSADSIVLISHVLTAEFAPKIVRDWDKNKKKQIKKDVTYPTYLKNGKINPAIIKQRKAISKTETIELSQTLASEKVEEINQTKCNMPHHTIIIYKNNSQSYIDLCFYCKKLNTSKDITLTEGDFNDNKWERLKSFFKKQGLNYQLLIPNY